MPKEKSMAGNR